MIAYLASARRLTAGIVQVCHIVSMRVALRVTARHASPF
jgi:hypothetical protein